MVIFANWRSWKIKHEANLVLNVMKDIVEDGYTPPSLSNGDDQKEVSLYENLKRTVLFLSLFENIATIKGKIIVRKHSATSDGVAAWKELVGQPLLVPNSFLNSFLLPLGSTRIITRAPWLPPLTSSRNGLMSITTTVKQDTPLALISN